MSNDNPNTDGIAIDENALGLDLSDPKAAFMEDNSIAELFGATPVEATEDATESSPEPVTEDEAPADPEVDTTEEIEEDAEDVILDELLGKDETEDDQADTDEESEETEEVIPTAERVLNINGEEVTVDADTAFDFYQKNQGREQKFTEREMKLADQEKTLEHLQYQGELAPRFYKHQEQVANLDKAKEALAEGKPFGNMEGAALAEQIKTAEVILDKQMSDLQQEWNEKINTPNAPGRKELEARLPDIADKFQDYHNAWGDVGREFGFTQAELDNNPDFRYFNLLQEVVEAREYKAGIEAKFEAARSRRKAKKGKVASSGSPQSKTAVKSKSATSANPNLEELAHNIREHGSPESKAAALSAIWDE